VAAVVTRVPAHVPVLWTWNICEGAAVPTPTLLVVLVVLPLVVHCAEAKPGRHRDSSGSKAAKAALFNMIYLLPLSKMRTTARR
jgi:hypothetical protein